MLRKSIHVEKMPVTVTPWDRKKCVWIANSAIIQCLIVYVGSATILYCVWTPDAVGTDFSKLARIMYLYDYFACGYKLKTASTLGNIRLPNETHGLDLRPIKWKQAMVTVSTKLSSKTRRYIEISLVLHVFWNILAIIMSFIIRKNKHHSILKFTLSVYFYYAVAVIIFDISMAVVYIAHIQQSLTKGMVLRYSGWSVELKLNSYGGFAGWLPMIASIFWMRGIAILILNIICCKVINSIRQKIRKKEVRIRVGRENYAPIPEPEHRQPKDPSVLYYRNGENVPFVENKILPHIFYN